MSQFYVGVTAGSLPPTVPTRFNTDVTSPAIPSGNQLNVLGGQTTVNNANGIETRANGSGSNNLIIELTNRKTGSGGTNGAGTFDLITFDTTGAAATYKIKVEVVGNSTTAPTPAGAGIELSGTFRTDGSGGVVIVNLQDKISDLDTAISGTADADFVVSAPNIIVRVTGSNDIGGRQIQWFGLLTYIKVS